MSAADVTVQMRTTPSSPPVASWCAEGAGSAVTQNRYEPDDGEVCTSAGAEEKVRRTPSLPTWPKPPSGNGASPGRAC